MTKFYCKRCGKTTAHERKVSNARCCKTCGTPYFRVPGDEAKEAEPLVPCLQSADAVGADSEWKVPELPIVPSGGEVK